MKTYKFKMYSNHGNRELHKTIDSHCHVWNHFVALCRRYYAIYGKYPGKKALMRHLTKLKRLSKFSHWNVLPSQSLQEVIDRLDKAYQKKFSNPRRSGRPRFKKREVYKSFTLKQAGWQLLPGNRIKIGKYIYSYFEIRLEDLNLQGMKSLWGRKVSDLGFADFVKKLVYIAERKGVKITFIDKWYPSSKTCSTCGAVNESLNLRDRNWQCNDCGAVHDRDRNAAINIFRVGASTLDGEDVRGGLPSSPC